MKKVFYCLGILISLGYAPKALAGLISLTKAPGAGFEALNRRGLKQDESEKVSRLIAYVRNMQGAVFIRNGKEYTPAKAADHLEKKYKKHRKKVDTARQFVEKLASESSSGKPYLIRFSDGRTVDLAELLDKELDRIEKG
ncbi:DUF5329 family protein [Adhaeribacter soli]|uniref:DUF5329 domain-containing protein n=1 Tax=Adhaeribacter soli TaxID=2607655 RepID=A0A5N1IQC5_9BACT|nr:DUF5329 family protein [Adhaeribacter soli]KAA9326051.1 hypothetical protein F0P94_16675 [Adhaeribacter soli]